MKTVNSSGDEAALGATVKGEPRKGAPISSRRGSARGRVPAAERAWILAALGSALALGGACGAPSEEEIDLAEAASSLCPGARDPYAKIEAESRSADQGAIFEATTDTGGGQNAGSLANGDFLRFDNVDFGTP